MSVPNPDMEALQKELDASYNEHNGIADKQAEEPVNDSQEEDIDLEDLPDLNAEADPETDLQDIDDEKEAEATKDSKNEDTDDTLDDLESLEDDEDLPPVDPQDPVGVQKKVTKEWQKRKAAERQVESLRQEMEQLKQMVMGGNTQQRQASVNPSLTFVPPAPPKAFEEMNQYEQYQYMTQVQRAEEAHAQQVQAANQVQMSKAEDFRKVVDTLKKYQDKEPCLKDVLYSPNHNFTQDMVVALAPYQNCASIVRHLHKDKAAELAALRNQSPDKQAIEIVRMAERYNLERERAHAQKAVAKKPAPAGKVKSSGLPNTNGKRDIYSNLDKLTPAQINKLIAKGY